MIRFLLIFSFLTVSLFARLNPFEPIDGQPAEDNAPRTVTNLNSKDDGKRTVKVVTDKKEEIKKESKKSVQKETKNESIVEAKKVKVTEPVVAKEITVETLPTSKKGLEPTSIKEMIPNTKKVEKTLLKEDNTTNQEMKIIPKSNVVKHKKSIKKAIKKSSKKNIKSNKKRVSKVKVKPMKLVQNDAAKLIRYNVLPLLTIDLFEKNLTIKTTGNYKLIQYYEEKTENKFVFDFQADISVPTAKEELSSQYYQSYIVGNHPEDRFFRVVIPVKDSVSNYKVMIKDNVGTVIHK